MKCFLTTVCTVLLFTTWLYHLHSDSIVSRSFRQSVWDRFNSQCYTTREHIENNTRGKSIPNNKAPYTMRSTFNITERNFCEGFNTTNLILCQAFYGRLGNNMFIYASNFCLAKKYGFRPLVPEFLEINRIFKLSREAMDFYEIRALCKGSEKHKGSFDGRIIFKDFNITCTRNFSINGMLQSFYNFIECDNDIRTEFIFRENLQVQQKSSRAVSESIGKMFDFTMSRNYTLVAIHVRRGDYITWKLPMAEKLFYDKARDYFRLRYRHVIFLAITYPDNSSREWCSDNLMKGSDDTFLATMNPKEVDMYILANSDHVIVSSGTFGWWGAWLNKHATVIKWNALYNGTFWNPLDFYPSHWILLEGPGLGHYRDSKRWLSQ